MSIFALVMKTLYLFNPENDMALASASPYYMVPSLFIEPDEIPLNINGKVDKRALPDVDFTSLHEDYVAPTTEDEKIIVEAFEKVFDQKIGIYDDFIRLGGDSIMAIRVVSLLEKNDINSTARDILTYKTPYLIAQNVEKTSQKWEVFVYFVGS